MVDYPKITVTAIYGKIKTEMGLTLDHKNHDRLAFMSRSKTYNDSGKLVGQTAWDYFGKITR